ncbi:aminotransferase class I/II-fold pyridoxal phosphate-dependent enzyme, partial [Nocardia farcinica]
GARATALVHAVRETFGERIVCTDAAGGMFVWADFTDGTDTGQMLPRALEAGVAYVPGQAFAVSEGYRGSLRMCFTTSEAPVLSDAVQRLAKAHAAG